MGEDMFQIKSKVICEDRRQTQSIIYGAELQRPKTTIYAGGLSHKWR